MSHDKKKLFTSNYFQKLKKKQAMVKKKYGHHFSFKQKNTR